MLKFLLEVLVLWREISYYMFEYPFGVVTTSGWIYLTIFRHLTKVPKLTARYLLTLSSRFQMGLITLWECLSLFFTLQVS